jgi:hypothetical protein
MTILGRNLTQLTAPLTLIQTPNALPPLPTNLSYEIAPTPAGGQFTGNIVVAQPRTTGPSDILGSIKQVAKSLSQFVSTSPAGIAGNLATFTAGQALKPSTTTGLQIAGRFNPTRLNMAFSDGDSGSVFGDIFGNIGGAIQSNLPQILNIGAGLTSQYLNSLSSPSAPYQTNMAAAPVVMTAGRAVATVGRKFFDKFPNLAVAIQAFRNAGKNVTRANLWSLMKRFGPDFLISGGILTAAAVAELAMAGPGRRRMNPGNVKALRRAHRRMKSFHHVCQTNDHLLHARRRRSPSTNCGGTRITQVK